MCGEKSVELAKPSMPLGSPPHVRGKVDVLPEIDPLVGITPAYAGKSPWVRYQAGRYQDHPRVCGEKRTAVFGLPLMLGSPPRMRGKGITLDNYAQ